MWPRPAINLRVDTNDADAVADAYFVYEPYQNHQAALKDDVWQEWDALEDGEAGWWVDKIDDGPCSQAAPCTWTTLTTVVRPGATLGSSPDDFEGSLGLNLGSSNAGQSTAADALTVGVGGESTTYDFENARTPVAKADCKGNNWTTFNAPWSSPNQGGRVSSLMSARLRPLVTSLVTGLRPRPRPPHRDAGPCVPAADARRRTGRLGR